jgi:hypothetical protein
MLVSFPGQTIDKDEMSEGKVVECTRHVAVISWLKYVISDLMQVYILTNMDFGSLLHAAKKNENSVKKEVRIYVANLSR